MGHERLYNLHLCRTLWDCISLLVCLEPVPLFYSAFLGLIHVDLWWNSAPLLPVICKVNSVLEFVGTYRQKERIITAKKKRRNNGSGALPSKLFCSGGLLNLNTKQDPISVLFVMQFCLCDHVWTQWCVCGIFITVISTLNRQNSLQCGI